MNEKRMCKIVQDLLPNYVEKLTNEETNKFIEEHLQGCDECQNVLNKMQKEINLSEEKMDEREVDYMKKFNKDKKKMRLSIKILLGLVAILLIYIISVIIKINILDDINTKYLKSRSTSNYYYHSEADNTIMDYWKNDEIIKLKVKSIDGNGEMTFWKNDSTKENLVFYEFESYNQ